MNKTYKGYELIKEIAIGNIKDYTKIIPHYPNNNCTVDYFIYSYGFMDAYYKDSRHSDNRVNVCIFLDNDNTFEVIEDEIDIQSIKEQNISYVLCDLDVDNRGFIKILNKFFRENNSYIDKILKAVKQLDNKIKEKE